MRAARRRHLPARHYAGEGWPEDSKAARWKMSRYANREWCAKRLARAGKQVFPLLAQLAAGRGYY
jgi:hypothetical protein